MTKSELRKTYKTRRLGLSVAEKDKLEDLILIQFQSLAAEIPDLIMTYFPFEERKEYDPSLIERFCYFRNPSVVFAYPVTKENSMIAVKTYENSEFTTNMYGIDEPIEQTATDPAEIQMIFVPLLAFDERGFRVGYGKGYYDRFLASCNADVLKIGFSFFEAEKEISDVNEYDIPLDICITPLKTYTFIK